MLTLTAFASAMQPTGFLGKALNLRSIMQLQLTLAQLNRVTHKLCAAAEAHKEL